MKLVPRFLEKTAQSFFLFGPRGTGKSLWVRENFSDAVLVDLLNPDTFRRYVGRPERLKGLVKGNPRTRQFIIDEIQKVPELLSVVHGLIEEMPDVQFVLTGSSARKIKRAGVDLMAGRALLRNLHPFMAAELADRFSLPLALERGLVPLVTSSATPEETLRSYTALYIDEEVRAEGLVRKYSGFARFLEAVTLSHGSVLNIANVARECEVERGTVAGYISILEDLLLAYTIPVFSKKAKRAVLKHSKFYLFDAGVFHALRPKGPLDTTSDIHGLALEGLVAQHLRAWISYRGAQNKLYYWRTRAGTEVDFILYGEDGLWAIEVKNAKRVQSRDLRPLKTFKDDYPPAKTIVLYRGDEQYELDGVRIIPCEKFLKELSPHSLIID